LFAHLIPGGNMYSNSAISTLAEPKKIKLSFLGILINNSCCDENGVIDLDDLFSLLTELHIIDSNVVDLKE
jgi:hypothetical protein